jgi:hypothetical protein
MVSLGAIPKRQQVSGTGAARVAGAIPATRTDAEIISVPNANSNTPPEMQRFKDAVKEAEKSTLIFNLDLGRTPVLNTDTMSKRATLALTSMAAVAEGRSKENPSTESIAVIDDVLSVVSGIHFFGNTTKTYTYPRDPNKSGAYCTIPIKYDFEDRNTRILAETTLRTKCNVNCTTLYPPILRECIRRVINGTKQAYPGNFVKATVDTGNFCLNVSRRVDKKSPWVHAKGRVSLPKEALDVRSKKIPDGLKIDMPVFAEPGSSPMHISPPPHH